MLKKIFNKSVSVNEIDHLMIASWPITASHRDAWMRHWTVPVRQKYEGISSTSVGQRHQCLAVCASLRMSGVQALLLVAKGHSGVGIFSVGHARCAPSVNFQDGALQSALG